MIFWRKKKNLSRNGKTENETNAMREIQPTTKERKALLRIVKAMSLKRTTEKLKVMMKRQTVATVKA